MIEHIGDRGGAPTGVPYVPELRSEVGSSNYGYVDLRKNPLLIDSIPELKDRPEMRSLIAELNRQESFFRTIGCDAWDEENKPKPGVWTSRGYIQIAFEVMEFNNAGNWDRLHEGLRSFDRNLVDSPEIGVDFGVKTISFRHDQQLRTSAVLDLFGWGRTAEISRANFEWTASIIHAFFASESARCLPALRQGRRALSDWASGIEKRDSVIS